VKVNPGDIAKEIKKTGKTVRQVASERKLMSDAELNKVLDAKRIRLGLGAIRNVGKGAIDDAAQALIARAWEIWRGTGIGLAVWQSRPAHPAPWRFSAILLDPPRTELRAAIAARAGAMLRAGGLDEVRALLTLELDPALPAMRAHGVPELSAYLRGELALPEATRRIELVTGQYTKRQITWFRHHQLAEPPRVRTIHARITGEEQLSERNYSNILAFIESMG
jgi:tRNA dimethylallyltransferase